MVSTRSIIRPSCANLSTRATTPTPGGNMANFTTLDIFWAVAFLLLMVGGAFFFYRLARRSESDFFLAGRGLPWWLPASSVFSTHTATDTPMWITGVIYANGLRGLWYTFFTAWTAIGAFVSARIFRRSLAYTQAEWQTQRFGGLGAEMLRGWMAGWQVFMNMFILGWVGIAMGKVVRAGLRLAGVGGPGDPQR